MVRKAFILTGVLASLGVLGGCYSVIEPISASIAHPVRYSVSTASAPSAGVFSAPEVASWSSSNGVVDRQRFEFARRDPLVGVRTPMAFRASAQWPQPLRPLERPIDFDRFRQDD